MVMDGPTGSGPKSPGVIEGCAVDNLAPVTAVTVRLDGGAAFTVPVDQRGMFTVADERLRLPGRHNVMVAATSATGRTSTAQTLVE